MTVEIQKGSFWKRISAFLFDTIMTAVLVMLFLLLMNTIVGYDARLEEYHAIKAKYETEYGVTLPVTESEYNTFDDAVKAKYDAAIAALNQDNDAVRLYSLLAQLILIEIVFAVLLAFLVWEFIIPLFLKEGRTLGKKIFGLCVVRPNCVRVSGPVLFIRSILAKCVIETLVPVFILIMTFFLQRGNIFLLILLAAIVLTNLICFLVTREHRAFHDIFAITVVADFATQRIFANEDALIEFKRQEAEEQAKGDSERKWNNF